MKITVLNAEQMQKALAMQEAIAASKTAALLYSTGKAFIPLRANLAVPEYNGQSLYMYGYVPEEKALGVKIVSVYPDNITKGLNSVPATMLLLNAKTGEVCCILDGTLLTRIRTGALAGAATDVLARKDSKTFALFGTGGQALSQLEAVLTVRPIELVKVYDVDIDRATQFAQKAGQHFAHKNNLKIFAVHSPEHAIMDADIITTVTTASQAVFDGKLVKEGAHINGVGSYTPTMSEIDEYIVTHSKVYVDTLDGALKESGDLLKPIQKNLFSSQQVQGELGLVLAGTVKGRESEEEITFFETTGSAVFDLVTAQHIYLAALKQKMGTSVDI